MINVKCKLVILLSVIYKIGFVMKYMNEYLLYSMYLLWHIRNLYTSMNIQCTYYGTFVTYILRMNAHLPIQCIYSIHQH